MKLNSDLHMHTHFSADSRATPSQMCWRALEIGMTQIAITDHHEWVAGSQGIVNVQDYLSEVRRCNNLFKPKGLTVLSGVELGNPHWFSAESKKFCQSHPFNVKIGSIHWLYNNINIHDARVFRGLNPKTVFADYFTEVEKMVRTAEIDILAHIDRIWWRATLMGVACQPQDVEKPLRKALNALVEHQVALELNTKHLGNWPNWNQALKTLLHWYKNAGGQEVLVNSDAHRPEEIGQNYDIALHILREVGFADLTPTNPTVWPIETKRQRRSI